MYVQVRTTDGKRNVMLTISKLTTVEEFKVKVQSEMSIKPELQRLFFRGKQLENGYKLFDYNVNLNDVIQLMIKEKVDQAEQVVKETVKSEKHEKLEDKNDKEDLVEVDHSFYYKVGDLIDCLDETLGAWFEAVIEKILKKKEGKEFSYKVKWQVENEVDPFDVEEKSIRPRARKLLKLNELDIGYRVMINCNLDVPRAVGFWYDFTITKLISTKTIEQLVGTIHVGSNKAPLENKKINPKGDIYEIEKPKPVADRSPEDDKEMRNVGPKRRILANCSYCNDNARRKCKHCGCYVCGGKEDEHHMLLCDECDDGYHLRCLNPPLTTLPLEDEWFCPQCKNDENEIVKAGDKLKESKKKTKAATDGKEGKRDWGKGMACVGRTKECTLVPPNHRGPIPGIEVGTCWMFRLQVSEFGVHRPHVAGIHGRETDCAYSLVLSGGYEDDIDNGDEFLYTGSGGRDLSGNKRTAEQSCDQTLTRMNKALALNCNAKLNSVAGAAAENWKGGIPVRVVRNYKLAKHSKYAPTEGNRYDGIYKVVKYYPQKGKSGFSVWRYVLRRDDPAPAPWTREGKKRIASLGLEMMYPDGFLEANKSKVPRKRALQENNTTSSVNTPAKKKQCCEGYNPDGELLNLIRDDQVNAKLWDECRTALREGKPSFLQKVSERFMCVCCQEVVFKPITTPCAHNICLNCLKRSFSAGVYSCPSCRYVLEKDYPMQVNKALSSALLLLYPGYQVGR